MPPLVSIITTARNAGKHVRNCLESVKKQTLENWELVFLDDGSTDDTLAIVSSLASSDDRMRVIAPPAPLGRPRALNMALGACRASYVAVLDADDQSAPERLLTQRDYLDRNPDVVLTGSAVLFQDEAGQAMGRLDMPLDHESIVAALAVYNPLAHSAVMYRREEILEAGAYPERFLYAHDYALYIELARRGRRMANLPQALSRLTQHPGQLTRDQALTERRLRECIELFLQAWTLEDVTAEAAARGRDFNAPMLRQYIGILLSQGRRDEARRFAAAALAGGPDAEDAWRLSASLALYSSTESSP